jgi:phage tail-like protein
MPPSHSRRDRLAGYTFRVKWDNGYIPHLSQAGPLIRMVTPVEYRDGADPDRVHVEPGRVTWPPVVLQRPFSTDTSFVNWANQVVGSTPPGPPTPLKKTVTIEIYTASRKLALRYFVYHCWPQAYEPIPVLGPTPRKHILETLTLAHEGWERDPTVPFPS